MKNQGNKLLMQQGVQGFLLGTGILMVTLALHAMFDEPGQLGVLLSKNPSFIFICTVPFILSIIFFVFAKSKLNLIHITQKISSDQVERDLLVEELRDYKLALDHSAMITVIDTRGKIKRVNNNFVSLTGCTSEYLLGRSILRLPSSLQQEKVFQNIKKEVQQGKVWKGEIKYYQSNGETRYTTGIVMPLSQSKSATRECLVIQYDITAEKKAHIALLKSESEKDIILSNTQTLICTHTFEGEITSMNTAGAGMLKVLPEQLIGRNLSSVTDPRYKLEYDSYITEIKNRGIAEGLMKVVASDGTKRTLFYRNIVSGPVGQQYVVGSAIDVSETLKAQKQVEDQRAFTRQILDISPNIICVTDTSGTIILSNLRFKSVFGCASDEVKISDFTGEDKNRLDSFINNPGVAQQPSFSSYECTMKDAASGLNRYYNVYRTEFTERQGNDYVLIIGTDVSEKQQAKMELLKAHSLVEQALKVKEQFIANMSHEIRTPLNAIIGFTDVLSETDLDFQQRDYVQTVKIAGQNLLSIINDVLDLSKIEAGMISLENKPMNISILAGNVKKLFEPKVSEKGLFLNVSVQEGVPSFVMGDQGRLNQVLINLVGNAVKFTHEGGVHINVTKVAGENPDKCYLSFSVADSGIGIAEEKKASIFNRFEQETASTHKMYGGTGLGLSISKNLVEMFGGEIRMSSTQGVGTTFEFTLPFEPYEMVNIEEKAKVKPNQEFVFNRPVKILLAEDNKTNARLAKQVLTKQGFSVQHVLDGVKVIEALNNDSFDLVLMDVQMAVQDGIETTRIIRNSSTAYANIPVIALTAHSFVGEKNICTDAGMNGYISKPFSPQQLYGAINNILQEKEAEMLVEAIA